MTGGIDDLDHLIDYHKPMKESKQTLMEYVWSLNIRNPDTMTPLEILELISEYLEKTNKE
jgi:hypothetical protein